MISVLKKAALSLVALGLVTLPACTQDNTGVAGTAKNRGGNGGTEAQGASPDLSAIPPSNQTGLMPAFSVKGATGAEPPPAGVTNGLTPYSPGVGVGGYDYGQPDDTVQAAITNVGGTTDGDGAVTSPVASGHEIEHSINGEPFGMSR